MDQQQPQKHISRQSSGKGYRRRTIQQSSAHSSCRRKCVNPGTPPLSIGFPVPASLPTSWVLSTSTKVLVEHLLYARGLIPLSVMQLNHQYENDVLKSPSIRRKVCQCRSRLESWNREWKEVDDDIFAHCSYILLSVGPSFSRAREFYVLNATNLEVNKTLQMPKQLPSPHALARRMLPRLVESDVELPSRVAPSYQIWVSIYVKQKALESLFASKTKWTPEWIQRPGFQLPTGETIKANQRLVEIRLSNSTNNQRTASNASTVADKCDGCWISIPTSTKGFRV
eukprot:scaffold22680_cov107-Cylindrotheca_fusiformis.AAC.29